MALYDLMRQGLLTLSASDRMRDLIEHTPLSREVVRRFVPGASDDEAIRAAAELATSGRLTTIDYLGEDTTDLAQAQHTRDAYLALLRKAADAGLTSDGRFEVSLKLSALGQALPGDGDAIALGHAREIAQAAADVGTTITLDMEDHTTTDRTLATLHTLRADFPTVGAVLQAYLHRTEADCRDLATAGSRVRLCKGAYAEPASVAYQERADIDLSYVRCLKVLMAGQGYPMLPATTRGWSPSRSTSPPATTGPSTATNCRCSSESVPTSRSASLPRATGCGSMCRSGSSGTDIWSVDSRKSQPT